MFTNVFWAKGAYGFNGTSPTSVVAINNQEIGKFNKKLGSVDVPYSGRTTSTTPAITGDNKIPILISDDGNDGKWMGFHNVPSTYYLSSAITSIPAPFEMWWVFRILPNAVFEAYFPSGDNCSYVANAGSNLRIINQNDGILASSTAPSLWTTHIGRLVINDQFSATLYVDNVLQGTYTFTSGDQNTMHKLHFAMGSVTNNADWDLAAEYFKVGTFNSTDASAIYTSLSTKWGQGTQPNQILLTNLTWTKTSGTYTPSATVVNTPSGVTVASPSAWDYQWYWRNNNDNLDVQTPLSTKYQLTTADFPPGYASAPGGFAIKVTMRPKDTNGNAWRWMDGTFANY
jgi:hypothetical protein